MAGFAVVRIGRVNVHDDGRMHIYLCKDQLMHRYKGTKGCIPWQKVLQVCYSWHKELLLAVTLMATTGCISWFLGLTIE